MKPRTWRGRLARFAFVTGALWCAMMLTLVTVGLAEVFLLRRPVSGIGQVALAAVTSLADLDDVSDTLSPSEGQVLKFSSGQWTAGTDDTSEGGSAGATMVANFPDVLRCRDTGNSYWNYYHLTHSGVNPNDTTNHWVYRWFNQYELRFTKNGVMASKDYAANINGLGCDVGKTIQQFYDEGNAFNLRG